MQPTTNTREMRPQNSSRRLALSHVYITSQTILIFLRSDVSTTCIQVLETTEVVGRQNIFLWIYSGTGVSYHTTTRTREIDTRLRAEGTSSPKVQLLIPSFPSFTQPCIAF